METPRAHSPFRKFAGLVGEVRRRCAAAVALLFTGEAAPSSAPAARPATAPVPVPDVPAPSADRGPKPVPAVPPACPRYSFAYLDALARRPVEGRPYSLDRVARDWAREFSHVRPELRPYLLVKNPVVRLAADLVRPGQAVSLESLAFCLALCRNAGVDPADVGLGDGAVRRQLAALERAVRKEYAMAVSGDDRRALVKLLEKYDRSLASDPAAR